MCQIWGLQRTGTHMMVVLHLWLLLWVVATDHGTELLEFEHSTTRLPGRTRAILANIHRRLT